MSISYWLEFNRTNSYHFLMVVTQKHRGANVISLSLKMREKYLNRIMEVSFTKISEDILVPTHLYDAKDPLPLSAHKWEWWIWGGLWLIGVYYGIKFGLQGVALCTGIILFFVLLSIFIMKLPFGWIELNRKNGTVTVWTSPKKRLRIAHCKFTDFRIDWTRRRVVTSRYSAEIRYSLGLYFLTGKKKYSKIFLDGVREIPFCLLYDMTTYNTRKAPDNTDKAAHAEVTARKAELFLKDFYNGKPLPVTKNTFSFSA
jgi:hypothetical protein